MWLFSNDTTYWQANSFKFIFQNVTSFFKLGGNDVNIYGGGTIDGNGQVWYDLYASNIYTLRPVLVGIDGLKNSILSNLVLRYSPEYYHFVANATNVVFDNINIAGGSKSANVAKNTDGWDTYRSTDLTIQNSVINNGDGEQILIWVHDLQLTNCRLCLIQAEQYQHFGSKLVVQWITRHFCGFSGSIRRRIRVSQPWEIAAKYANTSAAL